MRTRIVVPAVLLLARMSLIAGTQVRVGGRTWGRGASPLRHLDDAPLFSPRLLTLSALMVNHGHSAASDVGREELAGRIRRKLQADIPRRQQAAADRRAAWGPCLSGIGHRHGCIYPVRGCWVMDTLSSSTYTRTRMPARPLACSARKFEGGRRRLGAAGTRRALLEAPSSIALGARLTLMGGARHQRAEAPRATTVPAVGAEPPRPGAPIPTSWTHTWSTIGSESRGARKLTRSKDAIPRPLLRSAWRR